MVCNLLGIILLSHLLETVEDVQHCKHGVVKEICSKTGGRYTDAVAELWFQATIFCLRLYNSRRVSMQKLRLVPEQPLMHLVAAAAAAVFCTCPPALAEIQASEASLAALKSLQRHSHLQLAVQTVAPQDATSFARTLPKQRVNKGKVWLLFLAGATTLFGAALALEKSSALFPAIAKANQAIAATRETQKVRLFPANVKVAFAW